MSAQPAADQAVARPDAPEQGNSDQAAANRWTDVRTIKKVLGYARTVAIVGLSSNRLRPSFFVGGYLQYRGFRIVPVNPRESEILGERSYASLSEIPFKVDVVDVFRAPDAAPAIAEEAVGIGARALWLQFGVVSPQAAETAAAAGLDVVMDRCMKIEHGRYHGEMHWFGLNTGIVTSRRPRQLRSVGS